ncbi:MAG: MBL fold metallo-hydrolase [Candidatus Norongarragalinales archaeon]
MLELPEPSSNAFLVEGRVLVDPGLSSRGELEEELREAGTRARQVKAILLTHSHADHSSNARFFPHALVHAHPKAVERLGAGKASETAFDLFGVPPLPCKKYAVLKEERQEIEGINLNVIFTPGHTDDAVCFYELKMRTLFCGDTLFVGGVPRIFCGGSRESLLRSWGKIEKECSGARLVCAGHGLPSKDLKKELEFSRSSL